MNRTAAAFLAGCALLLACSAPAASYIYRGPGPLGELIAGADAIVVARCTKREPADGAMEILEFELVEVLVGELEALALRLHSRSDPAYRLLAGGRPAMIFLDTPKGQPVVLSGFGSCLQLQAVDDPAVAAVKDFIRIRRVEEEGDTGSARRQFALKYLAADTSPYVRAQAAEQLLQVAAGDPDFGLAEAEAQGLLDTVRASRDSRVAVPLCLVLEKTGAEGTDQACLHTLLESDALRADEDFRLAPLLARRPQLLEQYIEAVEKEEDTTRLGLMMTQFYLVPQEQMRTIYQRLWQRNAAVRPELKYLLGTSSAASAETRALLEALADNGAQQDARP